MKQVEIDKVEIVDWPPLNETQKRLRAALDWYGPNGEKWLPGEGASLTVGSERVAGCIWLAANLLGVQSHICSACKKLHQKFPSEVNALPGTTFATVRQIYAQAIADAA